MASKARTISSTDPTQPSTAVEERERLLQSNAWARNKRFVVSFRLGLPYMRLCARAVSINGKPSAWASCAPPFTTSRKSFSCAKVTAAAV